MTYTEAISSNRDAARVRLEKLHCHMLGCHHVLLRGRILHRAEGLKGPVPPSVLRVFGESSVNASFIKVLKARNLNLKRGPRPSRRRA